MIKLICLLSLIICANSFGYSTQIEISSTEQKVVGLIEKVNESLEGFSKIEIDSLGKTEDNWIAMDKYAYKLTMKDHQRFVKGRFVRHELENPIELRSFGIEPGEVEVLNELGIRVNGRQTATYTFTIWSLEIPTAYAKK